MTYTRATLYMILSVGLALVGTFVGFTAAKEALALQATA
jgi:hypothetical protein